MSSVRVVTLTCYVNVSSVIPYLPMIHIRTTVHERNELGSIDYRQLTSYRIDIFDYD